jgi:hypothetical protein
MPAIKARRAVESSSLSYPRIRIPDNGVKVVRVLEDLDDLVAHYVHWVELPPTSPGTRPAVRSFECLMSEEDDSRCPVCELGDPKARKRSLRIVMPLVDRKPSEDSPAAGWLEVGRPFFLTLQTIEAEYGPITEYDLKITVDGAGMQRKYSVLPTGLARRGPLGPAELAAKETLNIADVVRDDLTYDALRAQFRMFVASAMFDPTEFSDDTGRESGDATDEF